MAGRASAFTRSATACCDRISRISSPARRSHVAQAVGVVAVARRAARRAAAGGCWPGRAAPAGGVRASARATAVRPGAEEDEVADLGQALEQRGRAAASSVGQQGQELVGAAAALGGRIGGGHRHHCAPAAAGRGTGRAAQASRRRKTR